VTETGSGRRRIAWLAVLGVVFAPVSLLLAGAVTTVYAGGLSLLGVLLSVALVGAAIVVARIWPAFGLVAGGALAVLMLVFLMTGQVAPNSRPNLGLDGLIVFGGSGLLSAALVGALLASSLGTVLSRRSASGSAAAGRFPRGASG
jgi:hypothetical protein